MSSRPLVKWAQVIDVLIGKGQKETLACFNEISLCFGKDYNKVNQNKNLDTYMYTSNGGLLLEAIKLNTFRALRAFVCTATKWQAACWETLATFNWYDKFKSRKRSSRRCGEARKRWLGPQATWLCIAKSASTLTSTQAQACWLASAAELRNQFRPRIRLCFFVTRRIWSFQIP